MYKKIFLMLLIVLMISTPIYAESRNWQPVNYSDPELIQESGLTIEEFNQLIKEDWEELLTDKKEVSFAFLALDEEGNNITNKINPDLFINVIGDNDTKKARFRAVDFVNSAPRFLDINDQIIYETELFIYQINAEDIDNDELTYNIVNKNELPEKLTINQEGLIEWQTDYLSEGVYTIVIGVSDGKLTSEEDLTLTVRETNYVPVLNDLDIQLVNEKELLEFQIPANDIDNDTLTFSSNNLPEGADLSVDGLFSWKPDYSDSGEYTFNVDVSDGLDTDSNIYSVKVADVNVAPEFTNVENQTIKENEFFSYQLEASDIDGDKLTYSITNLEELPKDVSITNNGLIEWQTNYESEGVFDFKVSITDGELVSFSDFKLTVNNVSSKGLMFTGSGSYVDCGNDDSFNITKEITLQTTFEIDKFPNQMKEPFPGLIGKSNETYNFIVYDRDTSRIGLRLNYKTTTHKQIDYELKRTGKITITAVHDGENIKIYEDGVLKTQLSAPINILQDKNPVYLFSNWEGIGSNAQIWNKALSQKQIKDNLSKKLTGNEEGLVSYYDMSEGTGNSLIDKAGNNDCTIYNADFIF